MFSRCIKCGLSSCDVDKATCVQASCTWDFYRMYWGASSIRRNYDTSGLYSVGKVYRLHWTLSIMSMRLYYLALMSHTQIGYLINSRLLDICLRTHPLTTSYQLGDWLFPYFFMVLLFKNTAFLFAREVYQGATSRHMSRKFKIVSLRGSLEY